MVSPSLTRHSNTPIHFLYRLIWTHIPRFLRSIDQRLTGGRLTTGAAWLGNYLMYEKHFFIVVILSPFQNNSNLLKFQGILLRSSCCVRKPVLPPGLATYVIWSTIYAFNPQYRAICHAWSFRFFFSWHNYLLQP